MNLSMAVSLVVLLLVISINQSESTPDGKSKKEPANCFCSRELNPVCVEENGKQQTLNNKCLVECQRKKSPGLKVKHEGNCK
ncbi:hypothetical protein LSTR_LSTR007013 [Laodelphax striatellus]|uniref:Kazal-like domain-containing protein n=1 Tax=Laodelphax striatellus TaxID=195883 RepID=A0A482WJD5_LAOST|nr:hypothetical protein LSTR_LSTR007013 [Laodelphax striatellus]